MLTPLYVYEVHKPLRRSTDVTSVHSDGRALARKCQFFDVDVEEQAIDSFIVN